jgi:hypothetical protein
MLDTSAGASAKDWKWLEVSLLPKPVPQPRFAAAGVVVRTKGAEPGATGHSLLVIGGMNPERDLSDILIMPLPQ